MEESRLSLKDFLSSYVVVDKLSISKKKITSFEEYKKLISKYLKLSKYLNLNSPDEFGMFDNFRFDLFSKVNDYLTNNDKKKAKELMELLDKSADENKYPYSDENGKKYADYLRQGL